MIHAPIYGSFDKTTTATFINTATLTQQGGTIGLSNY